jgi:hypothetical protein
MRDVTSSVGTSTTRFASATTLQQRVSQTPPSFRCHFAVVWLLCAVLTLARLGDPLSVKVELDTPGTVVRVVRSGYVWRGGGEPTVATKAIVAI